MNYNKLSLVSLVLGLAGLFCSGNIWCIPICIISIVLGIVALTDYLAYKWPSICGIICAVGGWLIISYLLFYPYYAVYKVTSGFNQAVAEVSEEMQVALPTSSVYVEKPIEGVYQQPESINVEPIVEEVPTKAAVENIEETQMTPPEDGRFRIGETWEVSGQWRLTITGVRETTDRNQYSELNPEAVYIVSFRSENLGYQNEYGEGLYFLMDDSIVDSCGEMGYSYPGDKVYYQNETPIGAYCNGEEVIGVNHRGSFVLTVSKRDGNGNNQTAQFLVETP